MLAQSTRTTSVSAQCFYRMERIMKRSCSAEPQEAWKPVWLLRNSLWSGWVVSSSVRQIPFRHHTRAKLSFPAVPIACALCCCSPLPFTFLLCTNPEDSLQWEPAACLDRLLGCQTFSNTFGATKTQTEKPNSLLDLGKFKTPQSTSLKQTCL